MVSKPQFFAFFVIVLLLILFSFASIELAHVIDTNIVSGKQKIYREHLKSYMDEGYSVKVWHGNKYLIFSSHCSGCLPTVNNTACYDDCVRSLNGSESTPVDAIVLFNSTTKSATCYCVFS